VVADEIAPTWRGAADAPPAAGRRGLGQDGGGRAGRGVAIDAGWQCALMAPTEILAEQHFRKLVPGWSRWACRWPGSPAAARAGGARADAGAGRGAGEAQLVVGTHAVIQDDRCSFARLGLAIVDEQHRFGVAQRLALRDKLASARWSRTC
jgi:ATP-dependent DNA helicase RecG